MSTTDRIVGYRYVDPWSTRPEVGKILGVSRGSDDAGEPTDDTLAGTCAFETLAYLRKYARYSKGGWVVALGGERISSGSELAGEIIVRDAVVLSVEDWV